MRAEDIVRQLAFSLPQRTGRFSDEVSIATIVHSGGGTISVTTSTDHGLSVGNLVNIVDVKAPNTITSLTAVGNVATAATADPHDLTELPPGSTLSNTVEITGATESEYNGELEIVSVPDRNTFSYRLLVDATVSPATGSPTLLQFFDRRGFNGRHIVTSVVSTTVFEYTLTSFIPLQDGVGGVIRMRHRITRAESIESAEATYSRQNNTELWCYAVLDNTESSKDRDISTDAGQEKATGLDARQRIIFNASLFVFFPATQSIRGGAERDDASSVIMADIISSIVGARLPTGLTEYTWSAVTYNGDNKNEYVHAYYVHQYDLQQTVDITGCDRLPVSDTVALQQIDFSIFDEPSNILATGSVLF